MEIIDNTGAMISAHTVMFIKSVMFDKELKPDSVVMHPLQMFACLEATPIEDINFTPTNRWESYNTFAGARVWEDPNFPNDVIEFRSKDNKVLLQIKNLAVPLEK